MSTSPDTGQPGARADPYRLAVGLLALSYVNYSFGGLIVRSLDVAEPWQILFWRGLALAGFFTAVLAWRHRAGMVREVRSIGGWGVVAGCVSGLSPAGYVIALRYTTVANTVFILACTPFVTALLARILLGERIQRRTLIAMPVACGGIVLMVWAGVAAGALIGNMTALFTALMFSIFVIILRHTRARNMQPCFIISGLVGVVLGTVITGGGVAVPVRDAMLCIFWGAMITGVGHLILVYTSRHVPSAEITFLMLLEFVLAPVWVWLVLNEVPRTATLLGGALVLCAIAGWASAAARKP